MRASLQINRFQHAGNPVRGLGRDNDNVEPMSFSFQTDTLRIIDVEIDAKSGRVLRRAVTADHPIMPGLIDHPGKRNT